jgi:hypothetical protein
MSKSNLKVVPHAEQQELEHPLMLGNHLLHIRFTERFEELGNVESFRSVLMMAIRDLTTTHRYYVENNPHAFHGSQYVGLELLSYLATAVDHELDEQRAGAKERA